MSVPAKLKAVICDVDGTLYHQQTVRKAMAVQLAWFCLASPIRGVKTVRTLGVYRQAQESLRHHPSADVNAQTKVTADRLGYPEGWVSECVKEWMETRPLPIVRQARFPGLLDTLQWAKTSNISLGVLSDYEPKAKLQALEVDSYFTVVVSAQEPAVGRFKPDPKGLLVALQRLNVDAEQAVYIGDRLDVDYRAASSLGMPCCIIGDRTPPANASNLDVVGTWKEVLKWLKVRAG